MESKNRVPKLGEYIHYTDIRYGCLPAKPYEIGGWVTIENSLTPSSDGKERILKQRWHDDLVDLIFDRPDRIPERLDCRREDVKYNKDPENRTWHYIEDCRDNE